MRKGNHFYGRTGIVIAVLLLLITVILPSNIQAQTLDTHDAYIYPINGGTPRWQAFTTHDEMLKACQIPEGILSTMSTSGLVETVLNYPLYEDWLAYDSPQQGFEAIESQFNGLSELMQRTDAGSELLSQYQDTKVLDIKDSINVVTKNDPFSVANIELILIQDKILSELTQTQMNSLVNAARIKYQAKQQSAVYGQFNLEITSNLIEQTSQRSHSSREYNSYVYTPHGTAVSVIVDRTEMSQSEKNADIAWVQTYYPNAMIVSGPTNKYNCHSYAWYYQSSSNIDWMNDPSAYWTDGSYTQIYNYYSDGTKMRYVNGAHSAIVSTYYRGPYTPPYDYYTTISKWGALCLVRHWASYCPYNSSPIYYYH